MKVEKARAFADPEAIRRATRHAQAIIEDPDFKIGPSYFMRKAVHEAGGLERAWRTAIVPLLEEHHYGDGMDVRARYGLDAIRARVASRAVAEQSGSAGDDPADPA